MNEVLELTTSGRASSSADGGSVRSLPGLPEDSAKLGTPSFEGSVRLGSPSIESHVTHPLIDCPPCSMLMPPLLTTPVWEPATCALPSGACATTHTRCVPSASTAVCNTLATVPAGSLPRMEEERSTLLRTIKLRAVSSVVPMFKAANGSMLEEAGELDNCDDDGRARRGDNGSGIICGGGGGAGLGSGGDGGSCCGADGSTGSGELMAVTTTGICPMVCVAAAVDEAAGPLSTYDIIWSILTQLVATPVARTAVTGGQGSSFSVVAAGACD